MPKQKPENKLTDKEQWKRFREAAEKTEVDDREAEKAFKEISTSHQNHVDKSKT